MEGMNFRQIAVVLHSAVCDLGSMCVPVLQTDLSASRTRNMVLIQLLCQLSSSVLTCKSRVAYELCKAAGQNCMQEVQTVLMKQRVQQNAANEMIQCTMV